MMKLEAKSASKHSESTEAEVVRFDLQNQINKLVVAIEELQEAQPYFNENIPDPEAEIQESIKEQFEPKTLSKSQVRKMFAKLRKNPSMTIQCECGRKSYMHTLNIVEDILNEKLGHMN